MVRPELPLARFPPDCKPHHAGHALLQGSSPPCLSETRKTSAPMKQSPRHCVFVGCNRRVLRCHEHPFPIFLHWCFWSPRKRQTRHPPFLPWLSDRSCVPRTNSKDGATHCFSWTLSWASSKRGPHRKILPQHHEKKWTSLSAENYGKLEILWVSLKMVVTPDFMGLRHNFPYTPPGASDTLMSQSDDFPRIFLHDQLHPPRSATAESKAVSSGDVMVKLCLIYPGFYWCAVYVDFWYHVHKNNVHTI